MEIFLGVQDYVKKNWFVMARKSVGIVSKKTVHTQQSPENNWTI